MTAPSLNEIIARSSLNDLAIDDAIECVGLLVDYAHDHSDEVLVARSLSWCSDLEARQLAPAQHALLQYFQANAWDVRRRNAQGTGQAVWAWEQPEVQKQILHLRRAIAGEGFASLHTIRRCQILTNLANQMDHVGRFIEARAYWSGALAIDPGFWMAMGNRGRGLTHFANALYDHGHAEVFGLYALRDLEGAAALAKRSPQYGHEAAAKLFDAEAARLRPIVEGSRIERDYRPDGHSLGDTAKEQTYRSWCLRQSLFLNPLNDLGASSIAARDVLALPSFTTDLDEPPVLIGFFNVMKQEFVSARWMFYEAKKSSGVHFSDRDVLLLDTVDYAIYGLALEQLKAVYRATYSIFDKVAFFLNYYLKLGIPPNQVSFSRIWRAKPKSPVRPQFEQSENWPLRGLYWLSKDLFEEDFQDVIEPAARDLSVVRNHLEHKYLKVHMMPVRRPETDSAYVNPFFDTLAHSMTQDDLEQKCLHLLKLARSALIYLSLGMHREERQRDRKRSPGTLTAPMSAARQSR